MKELDDFTVERLEKLIHLDGSGCVAYDAGVVGALARIALAAKTAKPVAITDKSEITNLSEPGWVGNFLEPNFKGVDKGDEVYLYTSPILNSQEINVEVENKFKILPFIERMKLLDKALAEHTPESLYAELSKYPSAGPELNSPALPDGWMLVPNDPTTKQWAAGHRAMEEGIDKVTLAYRAMLAAAPPPPTTEK
ncbi:hypothetical protein [Serratia fonticola]